VGNNFPGPLRECDQDIERAAAERCKRSADPTSRVMALPRTDRRDLILELPVPRQQRVELVALGLPGHDAFQHVGQPGQWLNVVKLGGLCRPPNYAERAHFPQKWP
jgi:hypothetical protein